MQSSHLIPVEPSLQRHCPSFVHGQSSAVQFKDPRKQYLLNISQWKIKYLRGVQFFSVYIYPKLQKTSKICAIYREYHNHIQDKDQIWFCCKTHQYILHNEVLCCADSRRIAHQTNSQIASINPSWKSKDRLDYCNRILFIIDESELSFKNI